MIFPPIVAHCEGDHVFDGNYCSQFLQENNLENVMISWPAAPLSYKENNNNGRQQNCPNHKHTLCWCRMASSFSLTQSIAATQDNECQIKVTYVLCRGWEVDGPSLITGWYHPLINTAQVLHQERSNVMLCPRDLNVLTLFSYDILLKMHYFNTLAYCTFNACLCSRIIFYSWRTHRKGNTKC